MGRRSYREPLETNAMLIVKVHNDGSGTSLSANYDVEVAMNLRTIWRGRVKGHNRHHGWPALLEEIADAAWKSGYNGPPGLRQPALQRGAQPAHEEARESSGYEWMTTAEAAKYLQIKTRTLLLWTRQGKIKGHALSGGRRHVWRYLRDDLDAALLGMRDTKGL